MPGMTRLAVPAELALLIVGVALVALRLTGTLDWPWAVAGTAMLAAAAAIDELRRPAYSR